ncbi:MAG: HisA/HisF-related TIM barrel protein [Planctomycetes bacterium]|nr:HisA/HisF-related TIM barrel protein [Planctomycetota bacterium]
MKTRRFAEPRYLGDPINAMRIFSDKEADELVLLDIGAQGRSPDLDLLGRLASEAFMPVSYGGGITTAAQAESVLQAGFEKVVIGSSALQRLGFVSELAARVGSQSVVVSLDVRGGGGAGFRVVRSRGTIEVADDPVLAARRLADAGAGELIIHQVDRDGTRCGYDLELVRMVSSAVGVPVVALGGAGSVGDLRAGVAAGAAAVAAGSLFSLFGRREAVLLTYPGDEVGRWER